MDRENWTPMMRLVQDVYDTQLAELRTRSAAAAPTRRKAMKSYRVEVEVRATIIYEIEADSAADARNEATERAGNSDAGDDMAVHEVIKTGKAERQPE